MTDAPKFPDLDHHPRCENTTPDGMGCNCGAYAAARAATFEDEQIRAFGGHNHGPVQYCQKECPMFGKNRPSSSRVPTAETKRLADFAAAVPDAERREAAIQGLIDRATGRCRVCSRVITELHDHDGAEHDRHVLALAGKADALASPRATEADPVLTDAAKRAWAEGYAAGSEAMPGPASAEHIEALRDAQGVVGILNDARRRGLSTFDEDLTEALNLAVAVRNHLEEMSAPAVDNFCLHKRVDKDRFEKGLYHCRDCGKASFERRAKKRAQEARDDAAWRAMSREIKRQRQSPDGAA